MNGPPSWRCQTGAGNCAMFTSAPVKELSKNAAVATVTGGCARRSLRFSIQALSASSGRSAGSRPKASAARCTLVVALVKIRKPRRCPLISSNNSAGHSGRPAATSVMPPISNCGSAPMMRRNTPSLSTSAMNSRKSLYMHQVFIRARSVWTCNKSQPCNHPALCAGPAKSSHYLCIGLCISKSCSSTRHSCISSANSSTPTAS